MRKYFDFVQSGTSGRAVSGASVTVTTYPGGATASLFTDAAGTIPASNPLTTDKTGYYEFYTADGAYTLQFSGAGMTTETITNVQIYDITDVPLTATLAASSGSSLVGDGTTTVADRLSAINLASYTALRAYAGANQSAYITGYLVSANPSGTAGLFTRDDSDTTSADNGGTIIVAGNGKRWKRVFVGAANAKWFGAKGDFNGATGTDDTTAIQNAINYCLAAQVELYVPGGEYLISSSLNLTFSGTTGAGTDTNFYRGVTIRGKSRSHTKFFGKTTGYPVFDMTGARLCSFSDFQVRYDTNDANAPSCAFLMSRNLNNGGAGEHFFSNIGTFGYFTKATVAELSSEVNSFYSCSFSNNHPAGHTLYSSGDNSIGLTSSYIAGLDTLSYSGGNTRHSYVNTAFSQFAATDSGGQAIYIKNATASPSVDFLFSGCYSIAQPTSKASSITLSGNCADIVFDCHRDESQTVHSILIASGSTVSGLRIAGGSYAANTYGQDTSVLQYAFINPQRMATTYTDPGTGQLLSVDLYGFTFSTMLSPGSNGVQIRNDVTCSTIQDSNLSTTSLVIGATGTNLNGFRYTVKNTTPNTWSHYINGNVYGPAGFTGMTTNFMHMPSGGGAPVGTPADIFSGRVPFYYDATNNKFYVYNGAWKGVTLA